jgi:N-acetylglutamate synthase
VTIDGDRAARALTDAWQHLATEMPGAWSVRQDGAVAAVTTVPLPTLNGVWVDELGADRLTVAALLDRVAVTGLPHSLQLRPGCDRSLPDLATRRGMTRAEDVPLMVLEDPSGPGVTDPDGLAIERLAPEAAGRHAKVAAAGYEAPEEYFQQLMTTGMLRGAGVRCYLGEFNGEPVTTGVGITLGDSIGIFNIATPPAYRRRGFGAAVTARTIRDGLSSGARWAWLQSTSAGYPVYRRLGFRTLESWQCWLTTSSRVT